MAKASKHQVEAAQAVSAFTKPEPQCGNCKHSVLSGDKLLCHIELPSWVKRADRPSDYIVRMDERCALHTPED